MVHFHEQPNFRSIFECHFSYWISFSNSNLTLLISHCLRHITPLTPHIQWVFVVVIHAEEPNTIRNHYHQHQLGNVTGYPGVFQSNPCPYPSKPVPASMSTGFHRYGLWVYENPWVLQPAQGYASRNDK